MGKRKNNLKYLTCIDPTCMVLLLNLKYTRQYIRADRWRAGHHKKCVKDFCDCPKCQQRQVSQSLRPSYSKRAADRPRRARLQRTNEDFTMRGHQVKKCVTQEHGQDYRQATHIIHVAPDGYGGTRNCYVPTQDCGPAHPLVQQSIDRYIDGTQIKVSSSS